MIEVLVIAALALVIVLVGSLWGPGRFKPAPPRNIFFKQRDSVLTRSESEAYRALASFAAHHNWIVFPKVRLEEVVGFAPGFTAPREVRARLKLNAADFVICERQTMKPVAVIAFDMPADGKNHEIIKDILAQAGVPFLPLPESETYDLHDLAVRIRYAMQENGSFPRR